MADVLMVAGRYQLGNNPGIFQDATYVGHSLILPFSKPWFDPAATKVTFIVYTTDIETWGDWKGHIFSINGREIGRLKDPVDTMGIYERFEIVIGTADLQALLGGKSEFTIEVVLERQTAHPTLSDDFVLTRIATDASFGATLGW